MLNGIEIIRSESLAGMKKAVMLDGKLYVSPAMDDLMTNASPEELEHLFRNLPYIDIGRMPSIYDPLPMFTRPDA